MVVIFVSTAFIVASLAVRFLWSSPRPALLHILALDKMEYITWGIGLLTAFVIFSQLVLLQDQVATQTLMEFTRQWNDPGTISQRKRVAAVLELESGEAARRGDLDSVERVLEGLEDFSTFARRDVVDKDLVWDSALGWYAARYYHCVNQSGSLKNIRTRWCNPPDSDSTLYCNLEWLYREYVSREARERKIKLERLKNEYDTKKQQFIDSEKNLPAEG